MKDLNWNNQKCNFEVHNKKSISCKSRTINLIITQNYNQQRFNQLRYGIIKLTSMNNPDQSRNN